MSQQSLQQIAARWPVEAEKLANLTGERREKFEVWMSELESEYQKAGKPYREGSLAETTGPMCWLSFFDDGYTPAEALEEDLSNAEYED